MDKTILASMRKTLDEIERILARPHQTEEAMRAAAEAINEAMASHETLLAEKGRTIADVAEEARAACAVEEALGPDYGWLADDEREEDVP